MALASSLPDAAMLTALTLGPGTGFHFEAKVRAGDFKSADARELLAGNGFSALAANGWAYDAPSGTLVMRGIFDSSNR
jgi:hypothetical protein